jgi:hypothetical protein
VHPIDYANACPDVAVTSLHYYFPWAISALVKWSVFSLATGRRSTVDLHTERYFAIADDESLDYNAKLNAYLALADEHFETTKYHEWCAEHLADFDARVRDWVAGPDFDRLLTATVATTYPEHEQDQFMAHFRGLTSLWLSDQAG